MSERILEKTLIDQRVSVVTLDDPSPTDLIGVHATLRSYVIGMEGVDHAKPVATYINKAAALIGHEQVVAETKRAIVEGRAIALGDSILPLVNGTL